MSFESAMTPARFTVKEIDERAAGLSTELPLLSVTISSGVVPREESGSTQAASEDVSRYKVCREGDIVINRLRAFQGAIGRSPVAGLVSPDYAVLRVADGLDSRFAHYQMRSDWFVSEITKRLRGIGDPGASQVRTPRINVGDLGRISMYTPALDVQRHVAEMLDDETARIDALIAKSQRALRTLDVRWTRLVEDAVSGFDLVPLQYVTICNDQTLPEDYDPDAAIHYIDIGAVGQGRFVSAPEPLRFGDAPSRARRVVRRGDTLVSTVRTYLKAIVSVPDDYDGYIASTGFAVLTPSEAVVPQYLALACASESFAHRVAARSRGVSYPAINTSELLQLRLPLPDPDTQTLIVRQLQAIDHRQHRLRQAMSGQIEMLADRRRSVINAAVTGCLEAREEI